MNETEILNQARTFGMAGNADAFAAFADTYRCVSSARNSRRNDGKVDAMKLLRAYAEGRRQAMGV